MRIQKDQNGRVSVDISVGEWYGVVKKDPRLFVDVVNAIADGADRITFPSEDCFGDVKGGIANGSDNDLEHTSLRNLIRKCEDAANDNPKPPVDPNKVVEENREVFLKEIETIIGSNLSEKEKAAAMKKGETVVDNLVNIYVYAKEKGLLNISDRNNVKDLQKKILEIMEDDDDEEDDW